MWPLVESLANMQEALSLISISTPKKKKNVERKIEPIWWVEVSIITSLSWYMLKPPFEMSIIFRLIAPL